MRRPDKNGFFGLFGGRYVPETLIRPLDELIAAYETARKDASFKRELQELLKTYAGRPTPLTYAKRLSRYLGFDVYLKREDLLHTGAHKINNALGQALLAVRMGKKRIIAETGAGQHGVATATVCALFGLKCIVYMGAVDMQRQALNVKRMRLLGADVVPVEAGSQTLKEAVSAAIRDWVTNIDDTHYIIGSVVGPHPYPMMVRDFQSVIGAETKQQFKRVSKKMFPDLAVACVGGGSNAIGFFYPFRENPEVRLVGVEAGGDGVNRHAATLSKGSIGILQGAMTYVLQDEDGQILDAHSIAPGLDYSGVGPEHALLKWLGRVDYENCTDSEAIEAVKIISELEGIIPALESAHAVAYIIRQKGKLGRNVAATLCMSGRGDKDMETISHELNL